MRFLLFFVSFAFSFTFFVFYILDTPDNLFGYKIINNFSLIKFSPNLLINSIIFLLIGIIFFIFFSDFTYKNLNKAKKGDFSGKLIFIFYILLFYLFKNILENNLLLQISSLFFIFSIFIYNFLLGFTQYRKSLKYLGLFYIYLSIILNIIYMFFYDLNILIVFMLIYGIYFNFKIHKKYTNYVSLLFSIISTCFLIYFLYFFVFELYIEYKNLLI